MKILVVDDEDAVRELVKDAMVEHSYQVWGASSGSEALALGAEIPFDLVFCDVVMDGLSGFEVLRAFRGTLRSQAEIVLMTGQASVEAAIDAVQHGANDYHACGAETVHCHPGKWAEGSPQQVLPGQC